MDSVKSDKIGGKKLQGKIVGFPSLKTVKVEVESSKRHPRYTKILKSHKKYLVHNDVEKGGIDTNTLKLNDNVIISECKPISKSKSFILVSKVDSK